jgi:ribosomal protein S8
MAPEDFLADQKIADVLSYIRNNFINKTAAIKISEVKNVLPITKSTHNEKNSP